ncbi:hypothetical protein [Stutzerimonas stutzeri]|uniref:Antitoxin n=1 Tax=Stutzerimonas stutzeri TaxID=316 RepID=A0A6I6LNN1_STUST|nr:hypothetical protein [Stutzerimonas stutzeri]QGZ32068.1 hypothetical protein GQA94_19180 [Stutzerimonas stutzeri]
MTFAVLTSIAASMKEFKRDPIGVVEKADGEAVLVIERNKPAFYAVPPALYEAMMSSVNFQCPAATLKPQQNSGTQK